MLEQHYSIAAQLRCLGVRIPNDAAGNRVASVIIAIYLAIAFCHYLSNRVLTLG